ncbi:MAG: polyphenol oxidase family protein [Coriobacteriaceae bacterium]|nr:polyphenol oxidase family protein [Coriobacteriaceae bacterium]
MPEVGSEESPHNTLPPPRLDTISLSALDVPVEVYTDRALFERIGLRILFTGRDGGVSQGPYASLNLSDAVADDASSVRENRRRLLCAAGIASDVSHLVIPKQVHGTDIVTVDTLEQARSDVAEGCDAVLCARTEVPVLLCFADCVPLIMVAPDASFAVVHAGWRGTVAHIASKALVALADHSSSSPADCNVYIGPHIGPCCFQVAEDVHKRFCSEYGPDVAADASHIDLSASLLADLLQAQASADRICDVGICTSCSNDRYFSYRAQDGICGRQGAFACRTEQP